MAGPGGRQALIAQRTGMTGTIYATSSGPGPAGVAVIRLSGPDSGRAVRTIARLRSPPEPRRAVLRQLADPRGGTPLDRALVLWFPGPRSYTGEDMAELHVHGGPAVVAAVLDALSAIDGLRAAEPGEFTRRAFHNGKLDLTEVEGIGDLISARTEAQRRQALRQADGALGRVYDGWRDRLVGLLAHLEAVIDFPDEDIPAAVSEQIDGGISSLIEELSRHIDDGRRGEQLRQGLDLAIVGPPNAGKSSLLNWLARRDAAIVSETAGTTRDIIEVSLDLDGYPITLADTAGLRTAGDSIEEEGVRRARRRAESADLRVVVLDAADAGAARQVAALIDDSSLVALNKSDLGPPAVRIESPNLGCYSVSVTTGDGMAAFVQGLTAVVRERIGLTTEPALTRARHREALAACLAALRRSQTADLPELKAEDLRLATRELGRITGRVDVEDLLDVVFRDFCIGK